MPARRGETILSGLSRHVRKKLDALGDALSFELDAHSQWILEDLLQQFDNDTVRIAAANQRIEAAMAPFEVLIRLLETIPGVNRESAMAILIELRPDMSVFPSARHCAAWTGICPGNNESAGKRRSGRIRRGNPILRAILIECAHAAVRTRDCQFRSFHESRKSRRGYKRAIVCRRAQTSPHDLCHAARPDPPMPIPGSTMRRSPSAEGRAAGCRSSNSTDTSSA